MGGYNRRRRHLIYYRYVTMLTLAFAKDAKSLLDVGSATAGYIEGFNWIPVRHALDVRKPYSSDAVRGIRADFFKFEPQEKYDFCTCFQVLEHIPDARAFAQKLLAVSDRVLVSVPYLWHESAHPNHVHDPVSRKKLESWFGRHPDYSVVVMEPLSSKRNGRRLIAYYHNAGEMPPRREIRRFMKEALDKRGDMTNTEAQE